MSSVVTLVMLAAGFWASSPPASEKVAIELSPDSSITLQAEWSGIADSTYKLHQKPEFAAFFDLKPAAASKTYSADEIRALLPKEPVAVGDAWKIADEGLLTFLRQFHPSATTSLHHMTNAGGGHACLRAVSPEYAEIVFRLHVEFVLDPGKVYYTPGQFAGRMLIDRKKREMTEFELAVPDRNTNVDINCMPYADIVYVPRMRLAGGKAAESIKWPEAIEEGEARSRLAAKFYQFAAIRWTPFEQALARAKAEKKPLHVVVLFGTLDDESC